MGFINLFKSWLVRTARHPRPARRRRIRLFLEPLEDRTVLANFTAASIADLIADINTANRAGGSNTITLRASQTFGLTAVNSATDGATGLPVIAANNRLTIVGNGDTILRVGGSPAFRLIDVGTGASLSLQNLTLQGGWAMGGATAVSAEGGAIYTQGTLTLNGVTVQYNSATGANGASATVGAGGNGGTGVGGGVFVAGGTVSLTNVTLSSNGAQGGNGGNGGRGQKQVTRGGTSLGPGGNGGNGGNGLGGGLYAHAGTIALSNVVVTGNGAWGGSGGAGGSGDPYGLPGRSGTGYGGGLFFDTAARAFLDPFSVAHTSTNTAVIGPNISGAYTTWSASTLQLTSLILSSSATTVTAGMASNFTVTAQNIFGKTLTSYRGTTHFTSSDPQAVLPADYTFTAADNGVHTFSATLKTSTFMSASASLTATDTSTAVAGAVGGLTVNPAAASRFAVTSGGTVIAGAALSVTVLALDSYGNTASNYAGTIHFTSSDAQAVLPSDYPFTLGDNGVHVFSVTLKTAGTQSITATDTHTPARTGTAGGIVVQPGVPNLTAATAADLLADINIANQAGGANTITLLAGETFDLDAPLPAIAANDKLTIVGNGDSIEPSSLTGGFRLFYVAPGAALTLQNLTLQHGFANQGAGGALYNLGTLDLNGVNVVNNTALMGGGIYSYGTLLLEGGTTIENNQVVGNHGVNGAPAHQVRGGGIVGPFYPSAGGAGLGGGLYVDGGTVTITSAIFAGNVATGGAGGNGFVNSNGTVYNGAAGGNGLGGAIYVAAGTVTITGSSISGNLALGGAGGIAPANGLAGAAGNGFGAGLYLAGGAVTLRNDTVTGNNAQGGQSAGGGDDINPAAVEALDAFTLVALLNNTAASDRNIHGSYTLVP